MNELDETILELESKLALSSGFFDGLKVEDDWSFVLKCHALIETACSFLLTAYFGNQGYEDIFSRIEMSDNKKGKVAFLRVAGLVVSEEARFITALSELRNRLVHNIRGIAFRFSEHVSSLNASQRQSFAKAFGYAYLDSDDNNEKLILRDSAPILSDPKSAILHGVKLILGIIMLQVKTHKYEDETTELKKRIYELMIDSKAMQAIIDKSVSD
jgi:hypothetical protein